MTLEEARRLALALPETREQPHFELTSFRVRGRIFATAPRDGRELRIFVDEGEVRAALAAQPEACTELRWGGRLRGVRLALPAADAALAGELLAEAWATRAPKRLVAALRGGSAVSPR
jgi:hypothetical protein